MSKHVELLRTVRLDATVARDEGGQISALGVLAAAVFACLLLLVVNTGYATNGKIEMQNAADATAISGATWVARGLNVISLNNVTQTQLLAIILIIPSLDQALEMAELTLNIELVACGLLVFPVAIAICEGIVELQLYYVKGMKVVVERLKPLADRDGAFSLWIPMRFLSQMSVVIARTFPEIAFLEAYRVAIQDGADLGILIPARLSADGLPSLPVRKGTFNDLCDPTRTGSPSVSSRGYAPLLGYPVGEGPLEVYADALSSKLQFWLVYNSGLTVYFNAFREANYRAMCGGGGAGQVVKRPVKTLEECRARGGGLASWNLVEYQTLPLPSRQPGIEITDVKDPRLARLPQIYRLSAPCSWTPPGTRTGPGRYRVVSETRRQIGTAPDGALIYNYSYRISEYGFISAPVSETVTADERASRPGNDPFPMLLGAAAGDNADAARSELRYLGLTYRADTTRVAARYFKSAYGAHRLAYGQARVYNPTAFDLFTQDWRVGLEPASMVEDGTLFDALAGPLFSRMSGRLPSTADQFQGTAGFFEQLRQDANLLRLLNNH